jgi:uncharacterized membrane protein
MAGVDIIMNFIIFLVFLSLFVISLTIYIRLATDCMTCQNAETLTNISFWYAVSISATPILIVAVVLIKYKFKSDDKSVFTPALFILLALLAICIVLSWFIYLDIKKSTELLGDNCVETGNIKTFTSETPDFKLFKTSRTLSLASAIISFILILVIFYRFSASTTAARLATSSKNFVADTSNSVSTTLEDSF